jgi:(p)ppGpp synthase/HD superfamily hydrolase
MNQLLKQIEVYADQAHGNQMRKYSNDRYIVHPVRVMKTCAQYTTKTEMLAAALLHDVLEDTTVTEKDMLLFLETLMDKHQAEQTLKLVIELTDVYTKKAYPNLNRKQRKEKETQRIAQTSADSQTIKYADILDNCKEIVSKDPHFAPRFLKECQAILKVADKGDKELYEIVNQAVYTAWQSIRM